MAGGGVAELFYDPLGIAYDEGRYIAPIGGHSDHVHVSFSRPESALAAIAKGRELGLRVTENPYTTGVARGVHVGSSYHYKTFPGFFDGKRLGQAIDVSGPASGMAAFSKWVQGNLLNTVPNVSEPVYRGGGTGIGEVPPASGPPDVGPASSGSAAPATAAAGAGCLLPAVVQLAVVVGAIAGAWWWL